MTDRQVIICVKAQQTEMVTQLQTYYFPSFYLAFTKHTHHTTQLHQLTELHIQQRPEKSTHNLCTHIQPEKERGRRKGDRHTKARQKESPFSGWFTFPMSFLHKSLSRKWWRWETARAMRLERKKVHTTPSSSFYNGQATQGYLTTQQQRPAFIHIRN